MKFQIVTIVAMFSMEKSRRGILHFRHEIHISKDQSPKTLEVKDLMSKKPYTWVVGNSMYTMLCIGPDICYAVGVVSRY